MKPTTTPYDVAEHLRTPEEMAALRWVPFIGQLWPLTSLTLDGRNRVRPQCRPHGEFCLPESCGVLHGSTSTGSGQG